MAKTSSSKKRRKKPQTPKTTTPAKTKKSPKQTKVEPVRDAELDAVIIPDTPADSETQQAVTAPADENMEPAARDDVISDPTNEIVDLPSSRATFAIYLYPGQDEVQGWIKHILTRDKTTFTGLNNSDIVDFIKRHLPEAIEESHIAHETPQRHSAQNKSTPAASDKADIKQKKETRGSKKEASKKRTDRKPIATHSEKTRLIRNVSFRQDHNESAPDALIAYEPFFIKPQIGLPALPDDSNLEADTASCSIQIVLTDASQQQILKRDGSALPIEAGIQEYTESFTLPRLAAGTYWIYIHAFVQYERLSDRQLIRLDVQ